MPRLYLTPAEVLETPLGIALAGQLAQLGPGVLDKLLFRVAQRCDSYCRKRLGMPGITTLSAAVTPGVTSLPVASTLGFDNQTEQAVLLDSGGNQELLPLLPGGVTVTSFTPPYPGILTLAQPVSLAHPQGTPLQGVYYETDEAGRASSSDVYADAFTQEAQIALAHAPLMIRGMDFTRMVFLKQYPVVQLLRIEHCYSFDNVFEQIDPSTVTINPAAGWYKFRLGTVVLPQGLVRTTYFAGYQVIPDDVKQACLAYLRDELQMFANPYGAISVAMGKRSQNFGRGNLSPNAAEAEVLLERYRRLT